MCFNDNESTPLSQAVAVGVDELQSAPSFARSVKVNEDGLVDVLETPLESPNSPVYIRPRGVVEAPAVGYYSMHRQDDRTIIQINWLGKSKVSEIFCCLGVLGFTTYFAIFNVPGANTFSEGFTLFMRIFYATLMCCAVYLLACLFFNSVYITITRDGVKVDERPLKRYGFPKAVGFVDEAGLPVEFVVQLHVLRNVNNTLLGGTEIVYSVNQLDGNQQPMSVLPIFFGEAKHEALHVVQEIARYLPSRTREASVVAEKEIV